MHTSELEQRLRTTARWQRLASLHLRMEPLCVHCLTMGVPYDCSGKGAVAVCHIVPPMGDPALFFDAANLETRCYAHASAEWVH